MFEDTSDILEGHDRTAPKSKAGLIGEMVDYFVRI